jgi:hypothetical protein
VTPGSGDTRTLRIMPPDGNTDPVVLELSYGSALGWPVSGNPSGWTCDAGDRSCVALDRRQPAPLTLSFTPPQGGSAADRTYTATARIDQLYDTATETLPSVFDAETLLRIQKSMAGIRHYAVDFYVTPPRGATSASVRIEYGADLAWYWRDRSEWACRQVGTRTISCTVPNPASAGPLRAVVHVTGLGLGADAHLTATASAKGVSDTDGYGDVRGDFHVFGNGLLGRLTDPRLRLPRRGSTRPRTRR